MGHGRQWNGVQQPVSEQNCTACQRPVAVSCIPHCSTTAATWCLHALRRCVSRGRGHPTCTCTRLFPALESCAATMVRRHPCRMVLAHELRRAVSCLRKVDLSNAQLHTARTTDHAGPVKHMACDFRAVRLGHALAATCAWGSDAGPRGHFGRRAELALLRNPRSEGGLDERRDCCRTVKGRDRECIVHGHSSCEERCGRRQTTFVERR